MVSTSITVKTQTLFSAVSRSSLVWLGFVNDLNLILRIKGINHRKFTEQDARRIHCILHNTIFFIGKRIYPIHQE